jgi:hypothetical protein
VRARGLGVLQQVLDRVHVGEQDGEVQRADVEDVRDSARLARDLVYVEARLPRTRTATLANGGPSWT